MTDRDLLSMAKQASINAYVPYSRFSVGAALECADGSVFTGCNVENAAFKTTGGKNNKSCHSTNYHRVCKHLKYAPHTLLNRFFNI